MFHDVSGIHIVEVVKRISDMFVSVPVDNPAVTGEYPADIDLREAL